MKHDLFDLYTDYLISSFGPTTATGLARLLDRAISHDSVTRLLAEPPKKVPTCGASSSRWFGTSSSLTRALDW